jgi:hypothetical protein
MRHFPLTTAIYSVSAYGVPYTAAGIIILAFLVLPLAACDNYNSSFKDFFEDANGGASIAYWARTVVAGPSYSYFYGVAADGAGNVYAAGYQNAGSFDYGSGAVAGPYSGQNVILVKYDASGNAQWAKTVTTGSSYSYFYAVAVDGAGNVYAAGTRFSTVSYTYGTTPLVTVAGGFVLGNNVVLVKYNTSGNAQWAKTVTAASGSSRFSAVAVDGAGNVYAAGYQRAGFFNYGSGTVTGPFSGDNVVLVKYDASETPSGQKRLRRVQTNPGLMPWRRTGPLSMPRVTRPEQWPIRMRPPPR